MQLKCIYLSYIKTRNQEIFAQKLADYAVDCLWIFSYSNTISRGKMTCII